MRDLTFAYVAEGVPVSPTSAMVPGHKAISITVDGVDVTREAFIHQVKIAREYAAENRLSVPNAEDFVREMLAAANHDLIVQEYAPISEDEIVRETNPIEKLISPLRVGQLTAVMRKALSSWPKGQHG